MSDLISRRAAIDAAMQDVSDKRTHEFNAGAIRAATRIKLLPFTERKKGKWINRPYIYSDRTIVMKVCIHCQYEYSYDAETGIKDANFCPNCGADMRGEQG